MNPSASSFKQTNNRASNERLLGMDPNELVSTVENLGIEWANADEEANLLEEVKKTLLAKFITEIQAQPAGGKSVPMNMAETRAMARPEYKEHLEAMVRKRAEANRLRVRYDSGRVKIELLRSLLANERAAMQISGHRI